ncbi:MAG: acetate--CoA ligase family protein [Deltaproteobacteria bacterium]|nr:MAG: acetate--CoA ligase family protein [Deltaproteobacteria bacterium]
MRLLEYESKEILAKRGIPTPASIVVSSPGRVSLPPPVVIKAQIPLGGRQKAGGVVEALDKKEAEHKIEQMLSRTVRGYRVNKVLVEEKLDIAQEFYLGITYDTVAKEPIAIFSTEGGVDIEELAEKEPEKVQKRHFSVRNGLPEYMAREIISQTNITGRTLLGLSNIFSLLANAFLENDATIAEINPLAQTRDGRRVALDCHLEIDDDALYRNPGIAEKEKNPHRVEGGRTASAFEKKAAEIDNLDQRGVAGRLIEFDGNLGLIIGGGGASLTAFDAVQRHGGHPANYCEIGGNPTVLKTKELTKHILSKPGVEKIAVIMNVVSNTRVDLIARGVIKGILEVGRDPSETLSVFRVPGAWEKEGFKILSKYDVDYCERTVSIDQAARKAVEKLTRC